MYRIVYSIVALVSRYIDSIVGKCIVAALLRTTLLYDVERSH